MELLFIYERRLLELSIELPDPPNVTIRIQHPMVATPLRRKWGETENCCCLKAPCFFMRLLMRQLNCWAMLGIYPSTNRIFGQSLILVCVASCSGRYPVLCAHDICNSVISVLMVNSRR
jgi:hypothetical protein